MFENFLFLFDPTLKKLKISEDQKLKTFSLDAFRTRRDEIGDLGRSFFKMTNELQSRIDHVADFAADIAHELKNPITSIRSASETIGKIKNVKDQKKLINEYRLNQLQKSTLIELLPILFLHSVLDHHQNFPVLSPIS